jgi:hypothetical protein
MLSGHGEDKRIKQRTQITQFIGSLNEKTVELDGWAKHAENSLSGEGFKTYMEFRDLVVECESFNEVIQRRLEAAQKDSANPDLQEQLDALSARQITLAIHASLKFLRYIAEKNLPIGSRDLFIRELQDLHRMKQTLDQDRLKGKVDAAALEDQRKVEEILNVVIEKAPQLFSFDNFEKPKKRKS